MPSRNRSHNVIGVPVLADDFSGDRLVLCRPRGGGSADGPEHAINADPRNSVPVFMQQSNQVLAEVHDGADREDIDNPFGNLRVPDEARVVDNVPRRQDAIRARPANPPPVLSIDVE